jgi:hypothetical protein
MGLLGLSKDIRRIILSKEEVIDGRCHFNAKPLRKLLVLNAKVLNIVLDFDLLEKIRQTISLNDILSKSK